MASQQLGHSCKLANQIKCCNFDLIKHNFIVSPMISSKQHICTNELACHKWILDRFDFSRNDLKTR